MGFSTGSNIAEEIWGKIKNLIPEQEKAKIALELVNIFENYDCDTMYECNFVEEYLEYENGKGWQIK